LAQTWAFYSRNPHAVNQLEKILCGITINLSQQALLPMAARHQEESVIHAERTKTAPPPLYKVLLLNDDYTPMEFVIHVLERFFSMDREQATTVMLKVHNEGTGLAGIYPRDVAETKVHQVRDFARNHQHPLQCVMEENQ
jgi:ATP-dependent Clp protease adaptor protein ClpS